PLSAPFKGGVLGWLGYDFGWHLEKLPRLIPDRDGWEDLRLGVYDTFIVYDHKYNHAQLVACDLAEGSERNSAIERMDMWQKELQWTKEHGRWMPWQGLEVQPVLNRSDYESKICKVLDYLAAGDIFQANFTHRFEARGQGDPLALYERLARISPAPFAAFSQWDDKAIISSSPEWFYRQDGRRVLTRPIKGTRPRGRSPEEDAVNRAELLSSLKDKAELTMIVDLERNDLGRVAEFGSVKVNEAMKLESYAQVHHLVAEIEGQLRPDKDTVDLLAAMFPGGSITGAPKIRAMEIIEEMETHRRGPYTGSIGYISLDGHSAWNIAIRTILKSGECWSYNVGGGIVIDSRPDDEYEETLTKARGMKLAMEGADE
ncbi:MAG: aminodeoxychorismate synthase component I, partial [bacterium]